MTSERRGFTVLETVVAGFLFAYFTLTLMDFNVQSARHFDRLTSRGLVLIESKVAFHYLGKDLAKSTATAWNGVTSTLSLSTDGGTVSYRMQGNKLLRSILGAEVTVATCVRSWSAHYTPSTRGLEVEALFQEGAVSRRLCFQRSTRP